MGLPENVTTMLAYLYLGIIRVMTVQAIFRIRLRLYLWEEPEQAWLNSAHHLPRTTSLLHHPPASLS